MNMASIIQGNIIKLKSHPEFGKSAAIMEEATNACLEMTIFFAQAGKAGDLLLPILNACKFLEIFGDILIGHFLLDAGGIAFNQLQTIYAAKGAYSLEEKKALQAGNKEAAYYSGRIASAKFFANEILTTVKSRCESIKMGDKSALEMSEEAFAC